MKPSWKDAPDWANWLAMDGDGTWYWYESKPIREVETWVTDGGIGRVCHAACRDDSWDETLEGRFGVRAAQK